MKKFILIFAAIGLSFTTMQAQGLMQGDASAKVEKKVVKQTNYLKHELALTGKQELLVRKKLEEFAIKRHDVLNSGAPKADLTRQIKALEGSKLREMRDILTQPQYNKLLKIKEMRQQHRLKKRNSSKRLKRKTMSEK